MITTAKRKASTISAAPSADDVVTSLLDTLKQQRAAIAEAERPTYKTNRMFSFFADDVNRALNLAVVSDVGTLLKMAAWVQTHAAAYEQVARDLGVETVPAFAYNGFTAADWLHDIRLRIAHIQIKAKKEKLQQLEERLDKLVSPEKRRELELAAIAAELAQK